MAIAQMNWGRMLYPLTHSLMSEFALSLADVYREAERYPGFIWRVPDEEAANQLEALRYDSLTSATVSVWTDLEVLRSYTFSGTHGKFLGRSHEWFEKVEGPQLVIWDVHPSAQPTFSEAFERLAHLKENGPSERGYGWEG